MAVNTAYGVRVYTDGGTDTLIGAITRQSVITGAAHQAISTAGSRYPQHLAIMDINPSGTITTHAVAKALGLTGLTGLGIASATNPGVVFYQIILDTHGKPTAGSSHCSLTMGNGLLVCNSFGGSHGEDIAAELAMIPRSTDGSTAPLAIGTGVAAPTGLVDNARHTLGAVVLGGVTIADKLSVQITLNNKTEALGTNSNIYRTIIRQDEIKPEIVIRGLNVDQFAAAGVPLVGLQCTHANTKLYFRKRLTTAVAGFVADGTAEHIKLTAAGVAYWRTPMDASGNALAEGEMVIPLVEDSNGTVPLVIDAASAIT